MSKNKNQTGFTAVETILVLVFVILIGVAGYFVWHRNQTDKALNAKTKNSQDSSTEQYQATLSDTFIGDLDGHALLKLPVDWTRETIAKADTPTCGFAGSATPSASCLISINLGPKANPAAANLKVFRTTESASKWRNEIIGEGCAVNSQIINGHSAVFCAADAHQNYSDYVVADGHYLVYLSAIGRRYNTILSAEVHSLKFSN